MAVRSWPFVEFFKSTLRTAYFQVDLTIEFVSLSNFTPNAVLDFKNLDIKRFNRTHKVITGSFLVLTNLTEDYQVSVEITNTVTIQPLRYRCRSICSKWRAMNSAKHRLSILALGCANFWRKKLGIIRIF
jgi:hypothetical protein